MMTEDEARTKWCPKVMRHGGLKPIGSPTPIPTDRCIGSDCMWWVWVDTPNKHVDIKERRGHCGATNDERHFG